MFLASLLILASDAGPFAIRDLAAFAPLDRAVRNLPLPAARTVDSVGADLAKIASTPMERARAAYVWTVDHLAYSTERRRSVARVLADLEGDCDAHADVFNGLCRAMGVESQTVTGALRFAVTPGPALAACAKPLAKGQWLVGHSWNAVRIDGRWGLVDPTLGVRTAPDDPAPDDYFLVDPGTLATDHVPDDAVMRLAELPADLATLPLIRPAAWRAGFSADELSVERTADDGQTVLRTRIAWRVGMRAVLQNDRGEAADRVLLQPDPDGIEMRLCPTRPTSVLWLGLGGVRHWRTLVGFPVAGVAGDPPPRVTRRFQDSGASLLCPLRRFLTAKATTEIRLRAPGAARVAAFQGREQTGSFVKDGKTWTLRIRPERGVPVEIMASYENPRKFHGLVTYDVS